MIYLSRVSFTQIKNTSHTLKDKQGQCLRVECINKCDLVKKYVFKNIVFYCVRVLSKMYVHSSPVTIESKFKTFFQKKIQKSVRPLKIRKS